MIRKLLIAAAIVAAASTHAAAPAGDAALETRLKKLESELRCLVCQNQTLADSNADLAQDLRGEVRKLVESGKSDQEVKDFLVARYGDFVLYRPPVKSTTWLLWAGPFGLLAVGGLVWWQVLRRRRSAATTASLSSAEQALARKLLQGDSPQS